MQTFSIRTMLCAAAGAALFAAPVMAQDTMSNQSTSGQSTTADTANAEATPMQPSTTVAPSGQAVTSYPGNMAPPPADAMNKTYPVCRRGMTDNCQNPGEGGAPGRSRASDYKGGPAKHPAAGMGHHRKHHRR